MAEGKQHALSVGVMKMSADSMYKNISLFIFISVALCFSADTDGSNLLHFVFFFFFLLPNREKVNKGIGIENVHYLNDGLWHMKTYK